MPRPRDPSAPVLRDLSPDVVALEACQAFVEHLGRLAFVLNPRTIDLPRPDDLVNGSDLGLTVQTLTGYAQRGCPVGDWTDDEMAADGLNNVVGALCNGALTREATPGILAEGEPSGALDAVLLGAWARARLARRQPLEPRELATLASMSVRALQHLIASGEITASDGRPATVKPREARRWLASRNVPGI